MVKSFKAIAICCLLTSYTTYADDQVTQATTQTEQPSNQQAQNSDQVTQATTQTEQAPNQSEQESDQVTQAITQTEQASNQSEHNSDQVTQATTQTEQPPNQLEQESDQVTQATTQTEQSSNQQAQIALSSCTVNAQATCDFSSGQGEDGEGTVSGALSITHYKNCENGTVEAVVFAGRLTSSSANFINGNHGLHVHSGSNITTCSTLEGHFASDPLSIHGRPSANIPDRHAGDLGNIQVSSGVTDVHIVDRIVSLDESSVNSIVGRGMVLHALEDDFNPTRDPESTGAAGPRVGCCLIVTQGN